MSKRKKSCPRGIKMNIGKENEIVEFKKTTGELKEGLESISSILNKKGSGLLYFGVRNDGEVTGQNIGQETCRDISSAIRSHIAPECEFEIESKTSDDGKCFIVVSFSGDRQPYSAYGRYFIRHSDEDHLMTPSELEVFFKNKSVNYSDWEKEQSDCLIDDVDEDLLKRKIELGHSKNRIPYDYTNKEEILGKLGLLSKDKVRLTNAGEKLFSKNGPILFKLATFATETKETFLKLDHFQGNIYECINKGISYILGEISWDIVFDGSAERKEIPEIPAEAIREIIVNAFGHGKYASNTAFEIDVYKDKVCIYSPGFFPSGFTPEDFATNHEEPIMLNPKIVKTLFKTCEIESFGYGFDTVFKECLLKKIKYEYQNTKSGFRFIFYRPLGQKYVQDNMSKTDIKVFEAIKRNNYIRASQIANTIGVSDKTIYRSIKKLKEMGYIKRIGDDYSGYWEIVK